jgi:hypothetical protein
MLVIPVFEIIYEVLLFLSPISKLKRCIMELNYDKNIPMVLKFLILYVLVLELKIKVKFLNKLFY